ncbi:MAG: BatA domain-containing protein, partial [Bacteroidetes bacterium]|nr:BatA domain-containing protein [Bacteroidota bacterium]
MMTFLNPFVLFGLAAAAIPILIHLFNVRKLRTIEFSTLTFLKELNKNKIRRIKVRQWLLLALRTLLIILIVLAFSRPALQGTFGTATSRASSTLVILLDNTASMELHNEQGAYLAQAQQKAREIAATVQENDEVYLLRLSDLPLATTEEPLRDPAALIALIDATVLDVRHRTIEDGLRVTARLLQQSRNFNKEVYILTDGQATTLTAGLDLQQNTERLFEPAVRFFMLAVAREPGENVSVERMEIPPSLLQPGKPFIVNVIVKNHGTAPVTNHVVTMKIGTAAVMQKSVSLAAGEQTTVEYPLTAPRAGFLPLTAESEDDAFEADNRCYGSLYIPPQVTVAVIAPDPASSRYIMTALNAAASASGSSPVTVTAFAPSQLSPTLLAQQDVVVLSGIKELSAVQTDDVRNFIAGGGALLFFPSADTGQQSYRFLRSFGVPGMNQVKAAASVEKVDLQFPIFRGMFEETAAGKDWAPESPLVQRTVAPPVSGSLRSIITLSNGTPFMWQYSAGPGKLLGFAVPATTEWSDLPLKGLF